MPHLLAGGDEELVDHHLRAVDEVAVLRLPDHEPRRLLDVVAVLEPDDRVLGERAVVDLERGPRLRQRLQRHVHTPVGGVVEHGVAVAERAALDVFAGQPDADRRRRGSRRARAPRPRPSRPSRSSGAANICARFSRTRSSLRWIVNPSGALSSASFSSRSRSIATAVSTFAAAPGGAGAGSGST